MNSDRLWLDVLMMEHGCRVGAPIGEQVDDGSSGAQPGRRRRLDPAALGVEAFDRQLAEERIAPE